MSSERYTGLGVQFFTHLVPDQSILPLPVFSVWFVGKLARHSVCHALPGIAPMHNALVEPLVRNLSYPSVLPFASLCFSKLALHSAVQPSHHDSCFWLLHSVAAPSKRLHRLDKDTVAEETSATQHSYPGLTAAETYRSMCRDDGAGAPADGKFAAVLQVGTGIRYRKKTNDVQLNHPWRKVRHRGDH